MGQATIDASRLADTAKVRPMTGTFGALITPVDLSRATAQDAVWLREQLREHKVLVLPGQGHVTPGQLADFAGNYGQIEDGHHPTAENCPGEPRVKVITVADDAPVSWAIGHSWHTDGATRESPRWISLLKAIDIPDYGRDTCFADMEAAYERLSQPMKEFLDGKIGLNNWGRIVPNSPDMEHPLVATDPVSGRKAIYAPRVYTHSIKGMRDDESRLILDFLAEQVLFTRFQLRVRWEPGMVVIWDNAKTQHDIVLDRVYPRVLHRVMVEEF